MKLLARLANEFDAGREHIATKAFHHLLTASPAATSAFLAFVNQTGAQLEEDLFFDTEETQTDESRPDMVGKTTAGETVLFLEAKFDAGLTNNQPVAYLENLSKDNQAACVFVAPQSRHRNLWSELTRRCQEADIEMQDIQEEPDVYRVAQLPNQTWLMLTSWLTVLNAIGSSLETAGEPDRVEDINQLVALCERFEAETFVPIESRGLSGAFARRKIEFEKLIKSVRDQLVETKIAAKRKGGGSRKRTRYRIKLWLEEFKAHVSVDYQRWRDLRETPFWLGIKGTEETPDDKSEVRRRLAPLRQETPPRLLETSSRYLLVPLFPPLGLGRDAVVDDLVAQVEEVRNRLATSPETDGTT